MKELAGYSDDDLLAALDKARDRKGRIETEVESRFADRSVTVIETEHWTATQRQDTDRYVFTGVLLGLFEAAVIMGFGEKYSREARQISKPYVSLSKRKHEETPL